MSAIRKMKGTLYNAVQFAKLLDFVLCLVITFVCFVPNPKYGYSKSEPY